jgi:hypothetical protein
LGSQYTNLEGCQALIRALPDWSKINVSNLYKSLSAKLGRTLTFAKLHQALHALRPNIDKDIKHNRIDSQRPPRFNLNKNPQNRYSSYNLNAEEDIDTVERRVFPPRRSNTETSFNPRPAYRTPNRQLDNNRPRMATAYENRGAYNTNRNSENYGGAFNKFNTGPERGRTNITSNNVSNNYNRRGRGFDNRNRNEAAGCILCGYNNHKAENCRNMKDDDGNIKGVIPGFGTCSKCPEEIQPRLNHPESLCPFRPKGPLYKRTPA